MRGEERVLHLDRVGSYHVPTSVTTYLGHESLKLRPQGKQEVVFSLRHQDELTLQLGVAEAHDLVSELNELGHDGPLVGRARPHISRRREQLHHRVRHAHLVCKQ